MSKPVTVGVLGHVGNENLGDEAIIAAVIQNIRRRWPDAEIRGFSLAPLDTEERHGIRSFPIRRQREHQNREETSAAGAETGEPRHTSLFDRVKEFIKRIPVLSTVGRRVVEMAERVPEIGREVIFLRDSRECAAGLDLLIFAGSHQLNDFVGGPWQYPYTVLKWTLLARRAGAKVVFLSLGAGPIDSWLGRRFIRSALMRASYRSYRDETSKRVVDTLRVSDANKLVPDLAFSLESPVAPKEAPRAERLVVGINPLPLYTDYWYTTDHTKYEEYIGKLARFADWLLDRGCEVRFIPTQLKVDPAVIDDVRSQMVQGDPERDKLIREPTIRSLGDLRSELVDLDLMVATRYHGILLSLALHKPVMAIAYHAKAGDLMEWFGLGAYMMDAENFSVEALIERFPLLEQQRESIAIALRHQTPDFKSAVMAQYDEVFGLLEEVP